MGSAALEGLARARHQRWVTPNASVFLSKGQLLTVLLILGAIAASSLLPAAADRDRGGRRLHGVLYRDRPAQTGRPLKLTRHDLFATRSGRCDVGADPLAGHVP